MFDIEKLKYCNWVKVGDARTVDEAFAKVKEGASNPDEQIWDKNRYVDKYTGYRAVWAHNGEQVIRLHHYHF